MGIDPICYQIITGFSNILPYRLTGRKMPELGIHTTCVSVRSPKIPFTKILP